MKKLFTNNKHPFPQTPNEPMQKGRVALLSMSHFVNDGYHGFVAPLLPLLMVKLGFSLTLAALLTSIQAIFNSLSQPIFGHYADKIKRPYMTVWGPLITALFLGSIGIWNSYEAIVVVLIIAGLGTAAFHPQTAVLTNRASGRNSGLGMSIFVTGGSAGHALGPLIILPIVTLWGLGASTLTIIFGIIISSVLFYNLPALPHAPRHAPKTHVHEIHPRKYLSLSFLWLIVTIRALIIAGFITFLPIYLHRMDHSLLLSGSAITVFEISGAIGALVGGPLADKFGRKSIILVSFICSLPCLWLFIHLESLWAFIFLGAAGFILYSSIPVNIIMAQELFPERINTVTSIMMGLAWGIGGLLVTPLGALADKTSIGLALKILVMTGIISIIAACFLTETKTKSGQV